MDPAQGIEAGKWVRILACTASSHFLAPICPPPRPISSMFVPLHILFLPCPGSLQPPVHIPGPLSLGPRHSMLAARPKCSKCLIAIKGFMPLGEMFWKWKAQLGGLLVWLEKFRALLRYLKLQLFLILQKLSLFKWQLPRDS